MFEPEADTEARPLSALRHVVWTRDRRRHPTGQCLRRLWDPPSPCGSATHRTGGMV